MPEYEFVGGSQDGNTMPFEAERKPNSELRLPDVHGRGQAEVYVLKNDGRFHFARYGSPALLAKNLDEGKLADIIAGLTPHVRALDEYLKQCGGFCSITLDGWRLTKID